MACTVRRPHDILRSADCGSLAPRCGPLCLSTLKPSGQNFMGISNMPLVGTDLVTDPRPSSESQNSIALCAVHNTNDICSYLGCRW